jgi:outer membrane scaffolding protein for murein synthesis (MipA/OmpV family)
MFRAHHYRGSDQSKDWIFPSPYFKYVSKKMELEPSYIRGTFYQNEIFAIKLSLNAGLSADSSDNRARSGMPDLDWTLEAGPMVIWHIWKSQDKKSYIDFEFPARQVFATDLKSIKPIGIFMVPYINWVMRPTEKNFNLHTEISFAYMHATKKFHSYFYEVAEQFVTAGRPHYSAQGGYSGVHGTLIFKKSFGDFTFTPFARWDYLKGTVFEDSPLVKTKSYWLFGTTFTYLLN